MDSAAADTRRDGGTHLSYVAKYDYPGHDIKAGDRFLHIGDVPAGVAVEPVLDSE